MSEKNINSLFFQLEIELDKNVVASKSNSKQGN
jgi:hypothetical protein